MYNQLHIVKKESKFVSINLFTISRVGFSTPQIEKGAQMLSKRLVECHDAEYIFMPYNRE